MLYLSIYSYIYIYIHYSTPLHNSQILTRLSDEKAHRVVNIAVDSEIVASTITSTSTSNSVVGVGNNNNVDKFEANAAATTVDTANDFDKFLEQYSSKRRSFDRLLQSTGLEAENDVSTVYDRTNRRINREKERSELN